MYWRESERVEVRKGRKERFVLSEMERQEEESGRSKREIPLPLSHVQQIQELRVVILWAPKAAISQLDRAFISLSCKIKLFYY
jgi:hypothetical protein